MYFALQLATINASFESQTTGWEPEDFSHRSFSIPAPCRSKWITNHSQVRTAECCAMRLFSFSFSFLHVETDECSNRYHCDSQINSLNGGVFLPCPFLRSGSFDYPKLRCDMYLYILSKCLPLNEPFICLRFTGYRTSLPILYRSISLPKNL